MTALVWDATGEKVYEGGLDRGVLYLQGQGVAWNGLLSVDDENTDDVVPVYVDGLRFRNLLSIGDFQATLKAYTYPDEFLPCDGLRRFEGMYIDDQPQEEFSLSYRTQVGDDVNGSEAHYKIHLLYNLTAVADTRSYSTFSLSPNPMEFSWTLHSRPEEASGYRPTSHFIIDSKLWDKERLAALEEILYGTEVAPPTLPSFSDLLYIVNQSVELYIADVGNGEWFASDLKDHYLSFYNDEIFEVTAPTVVMIDEFTFDISTYDTDFVEGGLDGDS